MSKKRKRVAKKAKPKRTPASGRRGSSRSIFAVAKSANKTTAQRVAALSRLSRAVTDDDQKLESVLEILRDPNEAGSVRLAALRTLQAASFSVVKFNPYRGKYLATLRSIVDDADLELRQRVLGILARENDGFTQRKLLEGLKEPEKALLPPEKALQLLSYDVHAEAYPVARAIATQAPNEAAKREALRVLAADATSTPMFEQILRDKGESAEIRQLSASALHSLAPKALQTHAREMLLDSSEDDEIQATSLTALTQFGDQATLGADDALVNRVDRLQNTAQSVKVKQGARRFLQKYGR
jgi:hypothetical protein